MEWYYILLIVFASLLVLYALLLLAIYLWANSLFNKRQDKQHGIKYFAASDFDDIVATPIEFRNNKNKVLRGFIYQVKDIELISEEVIIFFQGIGMGHLSYTKEIVKLARETGRPVIGFDYQGCDASEGKKTQGFYKTLYDAEAAIKYVETTFPNHLIHLVGHSWGGFLSANVLSVYPSKQVVSVTSLSAPNSMPDLITSFLKDKAYGKWVIWLFTYLNEGKLAKITTVKSIVHNEVKTLIVHGRSDNVVLYYRSGRLYLNAAKDVNHIEPIIFESKRHLVYLTNEAEAKQEEMNRNLATYAKDETKRQVYIKTIDWNAVTDDDETVFAAIKDVIRMSGHGKH